MIFGLKAKAAVAAIVVTAAFGSGWIVKGKFEDSKDLAALQAQNALAEQVRKDFAGHSRNVEQRLSTLKANETVIDRGIIREIEKPVFKNVCIPPADSAFRLLNLLAQGKAAGESINQVPAGTANAD
jgi:hypothetical protein